MRDETLGFTQGLVLRLSSHDRDGQIGRRGRCGMASAAGAEQVLGRELLEADEAEALAAEVRVGVEVLVGGAVGEEVVVRLTRVERRNRQLVDLRGGERLLHLGVAAAESQTPVSSSVREGL